MDTVEPPESSEARRDRLTKQYSDRLDHLQDLLIQRRESRTRMQINEDIRAVNVVNQTFDQHARLMQQYREEKKRFEDLTAKITSLQSELSKLQDQVLESAKLI